MYFESANLAGQEAAQEGRGRLLSLAIPCLTTKYSLRAGAHSHTEHANLFRNSSLINIAHTDPAVTWQDATFKNSPPLSWGVPVCSGQGPLALS